MKRHQVMDLFHGNQTEVIEGPWNDIENGNPSETRCSKVRVKLADQTECFAYFYADKCQWIKQYGRSPCYFWDCTTKEPLHDVTHWKRLKEKND